MIAELCEKTPSIGKNVRSFCIDFGRLSKFASQFHAEGDEQDGFIRKAVVMQCVTKIHARLVDRRRTDVV